MENRIKVIHKEEPSKIHMRGDSNYITLCGLDGDDPGVDQHGWESSNEKIDCQQCKSLWMIAKQYKKSDFLENHHNRSGEGEP